MLSYPLICIITLRTNIRHNTHYAPHALKSFGLLTYARLKSVANVVSNMEEVIDVTDMPQEKRVELAKDWLSPEDGGEAHLVEIRQDAYNGELDPTPRTITFEYHGESRADALARGYRLRDVIEEETDVSASCELTGRVYELPNTRFYEMALHLNGGEP